VDIRFFATEDGSELSGRLVNLSLGGCCLRVPRTQDSKKVHVGAPLTLISSKSKLAGVVKWSDGPCRGIEFEDTEPAEVESFVRQFIRTPESAGRNRPRPRGRGRGRHLASRPPQTTSSAPPSAPPPSSPSP